MKHYNTSCGQRLSTCCFGLTSTIAGVIFFSLSWMCILSMSLFPQVLEIACLTNLFWCTSLDFQSPKLILSPWKLRSLDSKLPLQLFASKFFLEKKSIQILQSLHSLFSLIQRWCYKTFASREIDGVACFLHNEHMASIGKLSILMILIEATVFVTNTFGIVKIFNTLHSNDFHQNICMHPFGFLSFW